MDYDVLPVLNHALEATKPLATREPRSSPVRRSYILLRLALRAARRQKFGLCRSHLDQAIPGFSCNDVPISGDLIGAYNRLGHMLQAA